MCILLVLLALGVRDGVAQTTAELLAARRHARAAVAAYHAANWSAYEAGLTASLAVQPRHPVWLYNLAGAKALRGDTAAALALLDTIAALGFAFDPARDGDFGSLNGSDALRQRQARHAANRARIGAGEVIIKLEGPDFLPEGIACDPTDGSLLLSSVHLRRIIRVRDGQPEVVADSTAGLWGVFGIAFAPRTRSLWAVTAVTPAMVGYTPRTQESALLEIDVATGRVLRRIDAPGEQPLFNDLTVTDSAVYVSDARGTVYRWTEQQGLTELVPDGLLFNPSGLVMMPGTEWLYVADYPVGIARVSVRTGSVERLEEGHGTSTYGTDGLVRHGRDLIAIQNAVQPHRVARLQLDATGARIDRLTVLERASPYYDEPTLGVIVGDAMLYIANSRWARFRDGRYIGPPDLAGPVVLRLPLKPP